MQTCATDDELLALARGVIPGERAAELRSHLSSCKDCAASAAEAARALVGTDDALSGDGIDSERTLQPGAKLGRYAILELLGSGAMGAVYAAYDPQLDRRVAVKVLKRRRQGSASEEERQQRLVREAQAMARLRHPNVLAIHDAGSFEGGVFLAMDLASGGTVGEWLRKKKRSPREVIEVFCLAGEGLAAAHRAGIVHRDFKADNVLLDGAGHVYVTDFGVAHIEGQIAPAAERGQAATRRELTQSGAMIGTPAYMSPEQIRGEPADARSDVFGFCVALYEALYGAHPFPADDLAGLRKAICEGRVRPPPRIGVRRKVERALLQGLRATPAERFATMDELLRALRQDSARWASIAGVAGLAVLLVAGGVLGARRLEERKLQECRDGDGSLARLFDDGRQRSVQEAFARSGSPSAGPVFVSTRAALVAAAEAIAEGRVSACAARARGEASADLLDRWMLCLHDRAQDAAALVDAFAHADAVTVEKAVAAVEQLGDPALCGNLRLQLDAQPLPREAAARERISRIHDQLAQVAALQQSGHFKEGLPRAEQVAEAAQQTGYAPLEAEALLWRGRLLYDSDEKSAAAEALVAAAGAAMRARRDDLAAGAEASLVQALGWAQKTDEALHWAEHARGVVARGGDDPLLRADLLLARGYAESKVYRSKEALRDEQEALSLLDAHAPNAATRIVPALLTMAGVLGNAGKYREAIALDQRALPLAEKTLGPLHPTTLSIRANLGVMYTQLGDNRGALPILRRALADRLAALGPDHLDVARSSGALAGTLTGLGDYQGAVAAYEDFFSIVERKLGADHPELIGNLALSSEALARLGRFGEAYRNLDRSEALLRKHQGDKAPTLAFVAEARATALEMEGRHVDAGRRFREAAAKLEASNPGHPDIVTCKAGAARQLRWAGRAAEAERVHAALLAAAEKALGPESKELIDRLVDEGEDLLALRREPEARPLFERALKLIDPDGVDQLGVAELRFSAARAIWPSDHARGSELARAAQAALASSLLPRGTLRQDVRGWLASHVSTP